MTPKQTETGDPTKSVRVLIIEDEALVAENLRADLVDVGFEVVGIASRVPKALKLIEEVEFDVAVIDANLAGSSAAPAAAALTARKIPCIVLSGYARDQLPVEFSTATYVQKPYLVRELIRAVAALADNLKN